MADTYKQLIVLRIRATKHTCYLLLYGFQEAELTCLVETAASEVVGDDDVSHGIEDKLNVLCVGGAGHVAIDLLRR